MSAEILINYSMFIIVAPYCKASGDPHTLTFDGKKHDYQGTCRYTLVVPLEPIEPSFKVSMKTEHRGGKTKVSFIKYLEVLVYGQVIRLGKEGQLTVSFNFHK